MKLYPLILSKAKTSGLSQEDAEDVAQEVIISWMEYEKKHGKQTSQTINQAIIDAKRKLYGRTRERGHTAKHASRFGIQANNDEENQNIIESLPDQSEGYSDVFEEYRNSIDDIKPTLSLREQQVIEMIMDDIPQRQIADVCSVNETRVKQYKDKIIKKLNSIYLFWQRKEMIEEDRTCVQIDWICI